MTVPIEYKKGRPNEYLAMVDGTRIALAMVSDTARPHICLLSVENGYRRQGIALALVRFVIADRGKLYRAPSSIKNAAIHKLSAKLGDELFQEEA